MNGPVQTVSGAIADAAARLRQAGVEEARADARRLVQMAGGWTAADLIALEHDALGVDVEKKLEALVARRAGGEPVSRIRGIREFWGREFVVTPDVLDPRPDTETLVEAALGLWDAAPGPVLDLGVGSGAILLTLLAERPGMTGTGVDLSPAAIEVARRNADRLGLTRRVSWRLGSWFDGLDQGVTFSLIVSNPPYIPAGDIAGLDREVREHDPRMALVGGADGLDPYRLIIAQASTWLTPDGALAVEVGVGQAEEVARMMKDAGFVSVGVCKDLSGIMRSVYGHKRPSAAHNSEQGLEC